MEKCIRRRSTLNHSSLDYSSVHEAHHRGNLSLYRKVWRQLQRESFNVTRCTIARLMKNMGLTGVLRGKKYEPQPAGKKWRQAVEEIVSSRQSAPISFGVHILRMSAPDRDSRMWCSSSTCSLVPSWAGWCSHRWKRRSCWMRWSRRCGPIDRPTPSITRIRARSTSRWRTRSVGRTWTRSMVGGRYCTRRNGIHPIAASM